MAAAGTVNVYDGQYYESNVAVDKAMTIEGQSEAGVVLYSNLADSNEDTSFGTYDGEVVSYGFLLQSGSVTIRGLTIDGDNPTTTGIVEHQFRAGIMTDHTIATAVFNDVAVDNVTVQHTYRRGIQIFSADAVGSGNSIVDSKVDDVTLGPAIAVFDADVTISGSQISNTSSGIEVIYWGRASVGRYPRQHLDERRERHPVGGPGRRQHRRRRRRIAEHDFADRIEPRPLWHPGPQHQGTVTVENNSVTATGDADGIVLFGNGDGVDPTHRAFVSDNELTNTSPTSGATGVSMSDDGTLFLDGNFNPVADHSDYATITGNTVIGFAVGIDLAQTGSESVVAEVADNDLSLATEAGLRIVGAGAWPTSTTTPSRTTASSSSSGDTNTLGLTAGILADNTFDRAVTVVTAGAISVPAIFSTVQGGINAVVADDTVMVEKGVYNENITVNKSIALLGANHGVDARTRTGVPESRLVNGVNVAANNVTIDGFTVSGADGVGDYGPGIYLPGSVSGTHVVNNIVRDNVFGLYLGNEGTNPAVVQYNLFDANNRTGAASGQAIYSDQRLVNAVIEDNKFVNHSVYAIDLTGELFRHFGSGPVGPVSNVTITRNEISGNGMVISGQCEMWYSGLDTDLTVTDNVITGSALRGIYLLGVDDATIAGNQISQVHKTPDDPRAAIYVYYGSDRVLVDNNILDNNDVGVGVSWSIATVENNQISNSAVSGIDIVDYSSATVDGNTVTGGAVGVKVRGSGVLSSATHNLFTGNATDILIAADADAGAIGPISDNSISGSTVKGLDNESSAVVNASGNWWGSNVENDITAKIVGSVDYTPWLNVGTDTQPAVTGFQGDFSYLNVSADSPQAGTVGRIQEAINMVSGSTVYVNAGVYNEALSIAKAGLSLLGEGAATTTINVDVGTGIANQSGVEVTANNVTLSGFTVQGNSANHAVRYGIDSAADHLSISDVTVQGIYRSGLNFNGASNLTLDGVSALSNGGSGIGMTDVNGASLSNITTAGNAWNGVSVMTWGRYHTLGTTGIVFSGTNSFGEVAGNNGGLQLEEGNYNDPTHPYAITWSTDANDHANVTILAGDFGYALGGPQAMDDGDNVYQRTRFYDSLENAKTAAAGSPDHYLAQDRFIRTANSLTTPTTYYVYQLIGDTMSIQAAIDDSKAGDVVRVAGGAYVGNVDATGKTFTLEIGNSPAQVIIHGNLTLSAGVTLVEELNGSTPGIGYDQLAVYGTVNLGGALVVTRGFNPAVGQSFAIIDNDDVDSVAGQFAGLGEGATIVVNNIPFSISYMGGDGNDVTLTLQHPTNVWANDTWVETGDVDGHPGVIGYGDTVASDPGEGDSAVSGLVYGVNAFSSIADAVNAVAATGTVNVLAGDYVDASQIVIDKDLTIVGAGIGDTVVTPAFDTGDANSGDARAWWLVNPGTNLALSDLTLDGAGHDVAIGILHRGTGTIDHVALKNIKLADPAAYYGRGVAVYGGNVDITNSTFDNIGRIGAFYFGTDVTGTFSGNTYTGKGAGDWLDYGVELGSGAHVTITGNTITGNRGIASVDGSESAAILVTTYFGAGTEALITNNFINGNTYGVAVGYDDADTSNVTVFDNDLSGNADKAIVSTGTALVNASGNWYGVSTAADVADQIDGNVDYTPWLNVGTDTDPAAGFQGDFSVLNVDADSPQTGAIGPHPGSHRHGLRQHGQCIRRCVLGAGAGPRPLYGIGRRYEFRPVGGQERSNHPGRGRSRHRGNHSRRHSGDDHCRQPRPVA